MTDDETEAAALRAYARLIERAAATVADAAGDDDDEPELDPPPWL